MLEGGVQFAPSGPSRLTLQPDSFDIIPVAPDGNCLFASLAVAYVCQLLKKQTPSAALSTVWGGHNRALYLRQMAIELENGWSFPGTGVTAASLMKSSSGMDPDEYMLRMQSWTECRSQWGGFFEIVYHACKWKANVHIFCRESGGPAIRHLTSATSPEATDKNCALVWSGTHYDCVLLRPAGLAAVSCCGFVESLVS